MDMRSTLERTNQKKIAVLNANEHGDRLSRQKPASNDETI